jgi:hypothetical protein
MSDIAVLFEIQDLLPLCGAGAQPANLRNDLMAVHRDGAAFRDVLPATGAAFSSGNPTGSFISAEATTR